MALPVIDFDAIIPTSTPANRARRACRFAL